MSQNQINWEKPELVLIELLEEFASGIFYDWNESNPQ